MWGKIIEGELVPSGPVLYEGQYQIFNASEDAWLGAGYKKIKYESEEEDFYLEETETEIIVRGR